MNGPGPGELKLGVAILGAGASVRMGRPKLLLPWEGGTVVSHQARQWQRLGAVQVAVVHAPGADALLAELDRMDSPRADRIENHAPEEGMFSSIRAAACWARWMPELTHWAIALGDQPHLAPDALAALMDLARAHPEAICQPSRRDRGRHPVIFPRAEFHSLRETTAATLREHLEARRDRIRRIPIEDPSLDWDLDTPKDYERLLTAKRRA